MDAKLKHLDFIQSVVARQANNSFQCKAWAILLLAGLASLSRGSKDDVLILASGAVLVFWFLDAYYLSKERTFRNMYERVAGQKTSSLSLKPTQADCDGRTGWFRCGFALVELVPYGAMLTAVILMMNRG